jgi:hemerythrin superfamily protein
MDIYHYIKKDHRKVAGLIEQVLHSSDSTQRSNLFAEIKQELSLHNDSEQKTFYKAIDEATRSHQVEEKIEHAEHEHAEIRQYLEKLSKLSIESEEWMEQFGEFKHAVTHHVKEEESEVFEKAQKCLSESQAEKLTQEMETMKEKLKSKQSLT